MVTICGANVIILSKTGFDDTCVMRGDGGEEDESQVLWWGQLES